MVSLFFWSVLPSSHLLIDLTFFERAQSVLSGNCERFDKLVSDPRTKKMEFPGDVLRLPVMKAPETSIEHGRTFGATFSAEIMVSTLGEAKKAMADVASLGSSASAISQEAFGQSAAVFRPGGMAGSSSGQVVQFGGCQEAPSVASVADQSAFQGMLGTHVLTDGERDSLASTPPPAKKALRSWKAQCWVGWSHRTPLGGQGLGLQPVLCNIEQVCQT